MVKKRAARNRTNITNDQSTNETLLTTNHNNKNLAQTMQNNNLPNSSANIKASEKRPASTNIQVEYSNAKRVKASTNAKNSAKPIESTSSLNISATSNKTNNPAFSIANARFLSDEDLQKSEEGHLNYYRDCIIHRRFRVLRTLGQGTFGRVACVEDLEHPNKHYAMKIVRNVDKYRRAAEAEVSILKHLSKKDGMGKHLCVSMLDYFNYHGHMCIVFEKLGISVFDFLKRNDYHPYPMRQVRHMAYQLIHAVRFLHKLGITHTDLKPENMLFVTTDYDKVDCWAPGFTGVYRQMKHSNIRLIDFGSAIFDSEPHGVTVTTRHYRAPEVLMELGWSHPCDVWSVACIIFELFTGLTLFQTHDNREHLAMMERIVGNIPNVLGRKSQTGYFGRNGKLMWDKRTHPAKYVAKHCKPLHEYFKDCKPEISFFT